MMAYRDECCVGYMIEACRKIGRLVAVSRADFDASFTTTRE